MSKVDPKRAALIERIKIAATALEIPQDAVDHVIKKGSSYHLTSHPTVLVAFAVEYGISLDYLISDNIDSSLRNASHWWKYTRPKVA